MEKSLVFTAVKPDPRVWLFLFVVVSLLTFLCGSRLELFILFALLAVVMAFQNMVWKAAYAVVLYTGLLLLHIFLGLVPIPVISMAFSMMILLVFQLIPIYMVSIILLEKLQMNELLIALEQMRVPKMLLIPLAVVYRYIPTVKWEIIHIKDSLQMRGLKPSLLGSVLHPMLTIEKFMIPLLIRSSKLADELSAAALCKGLTVDSPRTSCTGVRFDKKDASYCILYSLVASLLFFLHYNKFFD